MKILIYTLATFLLLNQAVFAQKNKPVTDEKKESAVREQSVEIEKIKNITQYVSAMRDANIAAITLGQIADSTWKKDAEYARELFKTSLGKIVFNLDDSRNELYLKNSAYRKILSLIAKHDSNWAKELIKTFAENAEKRAGVNLDVAGDLLESDPKLAAEFAEQSIKTEITPGLIWFLKKLKLENEPDANRLFLQIVSRYPQQANPDAYQYALLGTYLFTSPFLSPDDQRISITRVGNIGMPRITENLPNISANLVQEYIRSAISIINRPSNDIKQNQMKYALAYLLLPKAREFAPNLIAEVGGAMAALASSVPPEFNSEDSFSYIDKKQRGDFSERIKEIEKNPDPYTRDQLFLDLVYQAWRNDDFAIAKTAAGKIETKNVRDELEDLILFGEANYLLKNERANLSDAERMAEKLPVGLEKTMLWLGIARIAKKTKQAAAEKSALDAALKSARQLNDENTPFLLLFVSSRLAKDDTFQSNIILREAIKEFNKYTKINEPKLVHQVTLEPLAVNFPLAIDGVSLNFGSSFQNAINEGDENVLPTIEDIKDERVKGQAFNALVRSILEKKPSPKKK